MHDFGDQTRFLAAKNSIKTNDNNLFGKAYKQRADAGVLGVQGNELLSQNLIDKINAVIQLVAIRDGYSLILDTSGGDVLYAKEEMDLTSEILAQLNKGK